MARSKAMKIAIVACFLLFLGGLGHAGAQPSDGHTIYAQADAHEGPVVVPNQNRLYFTSVPDFAADDVAIAIRYVDLKTGKIETFKPDANMANGMWLTRDGTALLVAEQGTRDTPGGISRIRLADGAHEVIVDSFDGKPFNSPNKVIEASSGWIYFSDPDYGYHQGFKDAPQLPMAVYAHNPKTGDTTQVTTAIARPHGLALSPDESVLYIGDTDAIDGSSPYDPSRSRSILSAPLLAPNKIGPLKEVLSVPVGIPDGFIVTKPDGDLWVAAGDGVRLYSSDGKLIEMFPIDGGAFNVVQHDGTTYSTADTAIWQTQVPHD